MTGSCPVSAHVCRETARERDEARAEVERLTHENADLRQSRDQRKADEHRRRTEDRKAWMREHEGEVERLRALGDRLAATVSLLLYDAHPVYGSTTTWHGGIGGQALTPVCCIIDGPPDSEWAQHDLPSDSLREWVAERGMDTQCLDAAKDRERAHLLALLNPTKEDS